MTPSPTSRRSLAILGVGLLSLLPVELGARMLKEDDTTDSFAEHLLEPPAAEGVWLLGNSIFKTGVDPDQLEAALDGPPVAFEYHGGHYTSLWYLIATNAIPDLVDAPGIVVWGFRPAFASLPAFRQNVVNDTELFLAPDDPIYQELALGIDTAEENPLDDAAGSVREAVSETGLYQLRGRAATNLLDSTIELGASIADYVRAQGGDLVRREVVDGDAALLDVLNNAVTGGEVQLAEERVVDGVGDFIEGDRTDLAGSFVPIIAERLAAQGLDQLVIIWPPVTVAEGRPDPVQDAFVDDALELFAATGIPVLDLYHDPRITLDFYASGDHFNAEGRGVVTEIVAARLDELGYG